MENNHESYGLNEWEVNKWLNRFVLDDYRIDLSNKDQLMKVNGN